MKCNGLRRIKLLGSGGSLLLLAFHLFALDPERSVFQYNCQNWTHQNLLPGDNVTAISQTKEGYIWLGTQKGLVRFDGLEFKIVNLNLPRAQSQEIKQFSRSRKGGLWIAINNGGFGYFDGQNYWPLNDEKWALKNMSPTTIREGADGRVWTGAERGLGLWTANKPDDSSFNDTFGGVLSLFDDSHSRVWVGSMDRGLLLWQGGKMVAFPDESLKGHLVLSMAEDAEGQLWLGTEAGLRCYDKNLKQKNIPALTDEVRTILVDRHGVLWIGTIGHGLARYQNGEFTFLRKIDGLASDSVVSLFEDIEGSLWVGTQDGLSQLSDLKFPIFSSGEGLIGGSVHSVWASIKGGLWTTTGHGFGYFDGRTNSNYAAESGLPDLWIKTIHESSNGDLYLVDGAKRIEIWRNNAIAETYSNGFWPMAFAEDAQGMMAGIDRAIYRLHQGKMIEYAYKNDITPLFYWINNLCASRDGAIWVASNNGIFRVKDGLFKQWGLAEGLVASRVTWIVEDTDGVIWAGTSDGISRIKNDKLKNIGPENGLFDNRVEAIIPDDMGSFWMDSSRGIFRVSRNSLNDFADGKSDRVECEGFDSSRAVKFSGRTDQEPSGCKTADGRVWFPRPHGVVMIDPKHYFTNDISPPVYIDEIRVKGVEIKDKKVPALSAGSGSLDFHFNALSYIAPEKVKIRFRLVGFDSKWIDAGTRRSMQYTNLKPGKYSFQVQACNADGVWNLTGDHFEVEFPFPFYESSWFLALAILLSIAAIFGAYAWKVRHMENRQRRLQLANEFLEVKVRKRTEELAFANDALRQEINERVKSAEALCESEKRYQLLFTENPLPMWVYETKTFRILAVNETAVRQYGYSAQEFRAMTILDIQPAEEFSALKNQVNTTGGSSSSCLTKHIKKDGGIIDVEVNSQPLVFDGHDARIALAANITERKAAENLIHEQAILLDLAHDAIFVRDLHGKIQFWNKGAERLYGWTAAEAVGSTMSNIFSESMVPGLSESERTLLEKGEWSGESRRRTRQGKEVIVDNRWTLLRDSLGEPKSILVINTDITERKELESQFLRAQRLEGIGTLATGMAHDLNNILAPILMSAGLLRFTRDTEKVETAIGRIEASVQRAAQIIQQVLTFGRGVSGERAAFNPGGVVDEVSKIIGQTFPKDITISTEIKGDLWPIIGDKTQVHQILLNLCINSRDAMPKGGALKLIVENFEADESFAAHHPPLSAGPFVSIQVSDTGEGIPTAHLDKIFDPFFTTKDIGKGTGLGLSTVLGIVKSHRGLVLVNSKLNQGTLFKVLMPASPGLASQPAAVMPSSLRHGQGETILLVDDESNVIAATRQILEQHGYCVLAASSGKEALGIFTRNDRRIDILITDLMMPGMDGITLIKEMRAFYPGVKAIASSGLDRDATGGLRTSELRALGVNSFLSKPYTVEKLLDAVQGNIVESRSAKKTSANGKERSPEVPEIIGTAV